MARVSPVAAGDASPTPHEQPGEPSPLDVEEVPPSPFAPPIAASFTERPVAGRQPESLLQRQATS